MREIMSIIIQIFLIFILAIYIYIKFNLDYNCLFFVSVNRVIKLKFNKKENRVTLFKRNIEIDPDIKFSFGNIKWWYLISNEGIYVVNRLTSKYKIYKDIADLPNEKLKKIVEKKSIYPWEDFISKS